MEQLVRLALDAHAGIGEAMNYSKETNMATLRDGLIEANNGKTYLDYRDMRDGKCSGLFTLIEEILTATTNEGLRNSDFFNQLVDEKNLAAGDENLFVVDRKDLFKIAEVAPGTQGLRRQRLNIGETFTVPMKHRGVRIYEEMDRVLSGRIDMNEMIDRVALSISNDLMNRMYAIWANLTSADVLGGATYYPAAGTYNEESLMELIDHVEAATGSKAYIMGTRQALRKLKTDIVADSAKEDMYNFGYIGKFNGANTFQIEQRHQVGSDTFIFPNNKIFVFGSSDKPLKYVTRGETLIGEHSFLDNADLTQEYVALFEDGLAWISADKFGIYEMA